MEQFTAIEVRQHGNCLDSPEREMLYAYADLLEAREKAEPVAWRADWPRWRQYHDEMDPLPESWDDDAPEILLLYTHSAQAQPPAARVPDWTDAQCVAFMAVGLRHTEYKKGKSPTVEEIRQGAKAALAAQENPNG